MTAIDVTTAEGATGSPIRIATEPLTRFAAQVYESTGVPPEAAWLAADTMVKADLWGHQSHGVLRLGWYFARLRSGAMKATAVLGT
jgi:LDH2 family malate/lactate/ureidoglycolate dehydrogenase